MDVRSREMAALEPNGLPGAQRVDMARLRSQLADEEREHPVVVYCNCPGDVFSAQAARRLRGMGFRQVWPLAGGLDAWYEAGTPSCFWAAMCFAQGRALPQKFPLGLCILKAPTLQGTMVWLRFFWGGKMLEPQESTRIFSSISPPKK